MDRFGHPLNDLLEMFIRLGNLLLGGIGVIEVWLRGELGQLGLPAQIQTAILIVVAVVLVIWALRLLAGFVRIAVVVVLLLLAFHIVQPLLR